MLRRLSPIDNKQICQNIREIFPLCQRIRENDYASCHYAKSSRILFMAVVDSTAVSRMMCWPLVRFLLMEGNNPWRPIFIPDLLEVQRVYIGYPDIFFLCPTIPHLIYFLFQDKRYFYKKLQSDPFRMETPL